MDDSTRVKQLCPSIVPSVSITRELNDLDSKISDLIQLFAKIKARKELLDSFADDPVDFINKWIVSQNRDLENILAEPHLQTRNNGLALVNY